MVGLENDMRARFFGPDASTAHTTEVLTQRYADEFRTLEIDIRDRRGCASGSSPSTPVVIELVIHTAAQPSHDWAASDPQTDFGVNANGTLNLLEATRNHAPSATFIFCSTNKVYGDLPNSLPLLELRATPGAARGPPLPRGHRHDDVDRRLDAFAVRGLQGGGGPARAGVRTLLRHADSLL